MESAHDVGSFKGLQLNHNLSTFETVQLINGSSVKPYIIKSKLPWHVIGTLAFVIDSDTLKSSLDISINVWRWEVYKTLTSSDISEEASYSVCDRVEEYRIVKRYYKCTDNHEFKRQILAIYSPGHQCKWRKNPYEFCRGNILISYIIPSETSIIKLCSKVRINKRVLDQVKRNVQKADGLTKGSFEVEKKFRLRKHPKSVSSSASFTSI